MVAGRMTRMTGIFTTPGFTDEFIHLYLAEQLSDGTAAFDHDEFIETVRLPLSAALQMVESGDVTDGKTIIALLFAHAFLLSSRAGSR